MSEPRAATDNDRLDPMVWRICLIALFGPLLSQLDATIVNVSLSGLAVNLHSSLATIQWVTSGYLLALTLILPLNGWLVERIGGKALYLWSFSGFTLTSALCGLAWSGGSLIGFRVLQGVSGGLLAPMAQMMVARAAGKHMARVIGYVSLPVLLAPIIGPSIAGAILQYASWRWLFLVNVPVGVLAVSLAFFFLPDDRAEASGRHLDLGGLALLSPGLVSFLYGAEHIAEIGGRLILAVGLGLIAVFLFRARRKGDAALIDLRLFKGKVFSACATIQFLSNGALFSGQMLIPIFLVQACGRTPASMGWILAPQGLGALVTYLTMSRLTRLFGTGRVTGGGALLALAATLPTIYLAARGLNLFVLMPALFLRGMGQGAVGLPTMSAAYASVDRRDLPMATTSINIVQRLGGPTLTTVATTLLVARMGVKDASLSAYGWGFALLCVLHGLVFLATRRLPGQSERK